MATQRIDKLLTSMGMCSRKEATAAAKRGVILVDGEVCRDASKKVDPESTQISFCGQPICYQTHVYIMMHKPLGVLSATEDREQKTVLDLLPASYRKRGVFPIGRLDKDTSGLLLLTDDGALGHVLTSPKYAVDKVYHAEAEGLLGDADVQAFAQGIMLRDGTCCRPAKLEIRTAREEYSDVLVTVREGKYHQVRRMLASRGAPVKTLERLSEGPLQLDAALRPGQWRELTREEIDLLLAHYVT